MKTVPSARIHLTIPDKISQFSSFDHNNHQLALPTAVTLSANKFKTTIPHSLSTNLNAGQRFTRFSTVSSSYAQFLKQRDIDKVKKIVSYTIDVDLMRVFIKVILRSY